MKIKTNGTIIGILCTPDEVDTVFNALVDYGVDSYAIRTGSNRKGLKVHCFDKAALPFVDPKKDKKDTYDWRPADIANAPNPREFSNIPSARIAHFVENFPTYYKEYKGATLISDIFDCFNPCFFSIKGMMLETV